MLPEDLDAFLDRLEAHHWTYERFGSEIDGDLTALCRTCHHGVTSMLRARRYAALGPPKVKDSCKPPSGELFDPFNPGASK